MTREKHRHRGTYPPITPRARRRGADLTALVALIDAHPTDVPCRAAPDPNPWTSEHPTAQALAAASCTPCPLISPCAAYAARWHTEAGVYGGTTEQDRAQRRHAACTPNPPASTPPAASNTEQENP